LFGVGVGAGSTALLTRKLGAIPHKWLVAARLAGLGNLHAGGLIAGAVTRTWLPISIVVALASRRLRFALLAALVVPNLYRWRVSRTDLDPIRYMAMRIADDAAYGAGVWSGVVRVRWFGALKPRFD